MEIPGLTILEKIGSGGMSTVWKAFDRVRERVVAVKILDEKLSTSGEDVRAMKLEERMMEEIRHPSIVQAYDFDNVDGLWYIVMEYVDGYTYADYLLRRRHVRESDCLLIAESVASALNYAWNDHGLVHCDLKPENLMINSEGTIKILDLGVSYRFQFKEDGEQEQPDHITGTPAYIAPEQVLGDVELDCRADIYSLGATLYHLASGKTLFPGYNSEASMRAHCNENVQAEDPRLYRPELSKGFVQMLEAMLVKNRDGRVSSWPEVYEIAQAVESGAHFPPRETEGASSLQLSPYDD